MFSSLRHLLTVPSRTGCALSLAALGIGSVPVVGHRSPHLSRIIAGILVALPCAFLLKRFKGAPSEETLRQKDLAFSGTVYEIALVVMSAYMAYLTAEVSLRAFFVASVPCLKGCFCKKLAASPSSTMHLIWS